MRFWTFFALILIIPHYANARSFSENSEKSLDKIEHIIVISLENHSFDNLFGTFPGADGIANAGNKAIQTDSQGNPYRILPPVIDSRTHPPQPDPRFPSNLPNAPFPIDSYIDIEEITGDLTHVFQIQQEQINNGKMDRFAATSSAGGLVMGYYDGSQLGLWKYAKKYTLADRFFHAAFGGSFLNHFWLICACTPQYPYAPTTLIQRGVVIDDGYVVNNIQSQQKPNAGNKKIEHLLPPQYMPTIGDRLSEKGISWAWYSDGWNDAIKGQASSSFAYHHQPFAYFAKYGEATAARAKHLKDYTDFIADLRGGTLPAVTFYKPLGEFNLHPTSSNIVNGDRHIVSILQEIENSPVWESTVVIVTFDENGGWWDHVPPPVIDRWGPGARVPTIIISPFAWRGYIDHTTYDTTSILRLIEKRFNLEPLTERDAKANDLTNALRLQ